MIKLTDTLSVFQGVSSHSTEGALIKDTTPNVELITRIIE